MFFFLILINNAVVLFMTLRVQNSGILNEKNEILYNPHQKLRKIVNCTREKNMGFFKKIK